MIRSSTVLRTVTALIACAGLAGFAIAQECEEAVTNDYPTNTRADYVYACMLANGQTREILDKCSCSIDVISSILPYDEYVEAETVMSLRLRGGESVAQMHGPIMKEKVYQLKLAQIEGELRCF